MERKIERAIVSVSDKTGLIPFITELTKLGVEIISTGGTAKELMNAGIPVKQISEFTGFPEMLDGRVKTLHPKVHGGILALRDNPEHQKQVAQQNIQYIDMVVVNLYPFEKTIVNPAVTLEQAIEQIDIGGPAMLRSAAKNFRNVAALCNPARYQEILAELHTRQGTLSIETKLALAKEVFAHTSRYDAVIAEYLSRHTLVSESDFPELLELTFTKKQSLRYGENPHQSAAFYQSLTPISPSLATATQLQGKELSFNNISDLDAALQCVLEFDTPACVIVKHANPCGVALGNDAAEAYQRAESADPVSAFGGVVAFNCAINETCAQKMHKKFLEAIIAPELTPAAKHILSTKPDVRILTTDFTGSNSNVHHTNLVFRHVRGGILVQTADELLLDERKLTVVTKTQPTSEMFNDMKFAWKVVKHLKSNAIAIAKDNVTLGLGMGQTNRVDAVRHAIARAGDKVKGAVLASDAFFPFNDSVLEAAKAGIVAIIQPGGSKRDQDSIDACNEAGIAMVFTGIRHFRH
ncbi:MAG: bifunctional phosphoribosylaminoimidazolecarboxamide formyltransferase/IMP cyclohydrolase [bacterium]|nr:bifunctional phosphoribosylaminoimidazolecarboxamide formyltransferase/IMP cyclohydrolase [bacterium]